MPPAARITDKHSCAKHPPNKVASGESTVLVGYQPQARVSDSEDCGATITKGESTVIVEGQEAARKGDPTSHGGTVASGCPTVIIGANPWSDKPFQQDCKKKEKEEDAREKAGRGS
jgi:uncharacterized Zn-binding protein involved in type VI secretion